MGVSADLASPPWAAADFAGEGMGSRPPSWEMALGGGRTYLDFLEWNMTQAMQWTEKKERSQEVTSEVIESNH